MFCRSRTSASGCPGAGPRTVGRPPLRSHEGHRAGARGRRSPARSVVAGGLVAALLLSGCGAHLETGWLPSTSTTTNQTGRIISLWNGSWIAAWLVGALVWGLILWCVVAYRRRRNDVGFPTQIRYNLPLEILYTVVPLMMIAVLFFFTARDEAAIADVSAKPDVTINVVGKQWAWDFNYVQTPAADVYEAGVQGQLDGPARRREAAAHPVPAGRPPGASSSSPRATSTTPSGSPPSSTRWTSSRACGTSSRSCRADRRPTAASAPSCAASTTRRCCSTSRSSRRPTSTRTCSSCVRRATSAARLQPRPQLHPAGRRGRSRRHHQRRRRHREQVT